MLNLIDILETQVDWNRFFGVVEDVYNDPGFASIADNFIVSSTVEFALAEFSPLFRVDQKGFDFLVENTDVDDEYVRTINNITGEPIELKIGKNIFFKRRPHTLKPIKIKNFQGDKKTVEDFQKESTFSKLIIIDLTARKVVVIEDDVARSKYYAAGDGVFAQFDLGDYYCCDIGDVNPIRSNSLLSDALNKVKKEFILNR